MELKQFLKKHCQCLVGRVCGNFFNVNFQKENRYFETFTQTGLLSSFKWQHSLLPQVKIFFHCKKFLLLHMLYNTVGVTREMSYTVLRHIPGLGFFLLPLIWDRQLIAAWNQLSQTTAESWTTQTQKLCLIFCSVHHPVK